MQPLVSLSELRTKLNLPWSIGQLRRMTQDGIFKPIRVNGNCKMYFRPEQIEEALIKMQEEQAIELEQKKKAKGNKQAK